MEKSKRDDEVESSRWVFSLRDTVMLLTVIVSAVVFVVVALTRAQAVEQVMRDGFASVRTEIAQIRVDLRDHGAMEERLIGKIEERQRGVMDRVSSLEARQDRDEGMMDANKPSNGKTR